MHDMWFMGLFRSGRGNSGEIARNRLKEVLVLDATSLSAGILEMIRNDIREAITRYTDCDPVMIELKTHRIEAPDRNTLSFIVSVPVQKLIRLRNE